MTGAGRLSSGPQPVMANAAPLCLSCTYRARSTVSGNISARRPSPSGMARRVKTGANRGFSDSRQPGPEGRRQSLAVTRALPVSALVKLGHIQPIGTDGGVPASMCKIIRSRPPPTMEAATQDLAVNHFVDIKKSTGISGRRWHLPRAGRKLTPSL